MKCPKCGKESDAKFCPECGTKMEEHKQPINHNRRYEHQRTTKSPIYKKWWFWVLIVLAVFIIIGTLAGSNDKDKNSSSDSSSAATSSNTSSSAPSSNKKTSTDSGALGKYEVTIKDAKLAKDYEGNPAMIVTFSYKNNSDKAQSFSSSVHDIAYQDGVQLSTGIIFGSDNPGYEAGDSLKNVQPGATIDIQQSYKLSNTSSPVQVEVAELFSFSNEKLTKTFDPASLPNN